MTLRFYFPCLYQILTDFCVEKQSAASAHTHVNHRIFTCQPLLRGCTEYVGADLLRHFRDILQSNISVVTDIGEEGAEMTVFRFKKRKEFFLIGDTVFLGRGEEVTIKGNLLTRITFIKKRLLV